MIPGEIITAPGEIVLNDGRPTVTVTVANGRLEVRPWQIMMPCGTEV